MIYWDFEQRSEKWFEMRLGGVTSSRCGDVCAKVKDPRKMSEYRRKYLDEIIAERLSGTPVYHEVSKVMLAGLADEPLARAEYEFRTGNKVTQIGLATHPEIERFSASTDGLVEVPDSDDLGVLEIKCLKKENHTRILRTKQIPEEHHWQLYGELACTRCRWVDFVSYCADMPEKHQIWIRRFEWNQGMVFGLESEVIQFLGEVDREIQQLEKDHENQIIERLQPA